MAWGGVGWGARGTATAGLHLRAGEGTPPRHGTHVKDACVRTSELERQLGEALLSQVVARWAQAVQVPTTCKQ